MKNTFGNSLCITLFGESHGECVGIVADGLTAGIPICKDAISSMLKRRKPREFYESSRREDDEFSIVSGIYNGRTTGSPLCLIIKNKDADGKAYDNYSDMPRPGHADYTAFCKYHGFEDHRGGGHFSGRLTAPIVALGAVIIPMLNKKGIYVGTHIKKIGKAEDRAFCDIKNDICLLNSSDGFLLDGSIKSKMDDEIKAAQSMSDSIGGILETAIYGVFEGTGEPFFDSVESELSHILFSIPAIKGVSFGAGFGFAELYGSDANDGMYFENGKVLTKTNNNGGICGGITNGMPIMLSCVVKPTPSVSKKQETVSLSKLTNETISISGRHDACIVRRAAPVVESACAIAICDLLLSRFGTDYFGDVL